MSKIVCDVCGAAYPETSSRCPVCGSVRYNTPESDAETAPEPRAEREERPAPSRRPSTQNKRRSPKKNKPNVKLIAIVAAVIALDKNSIIFNIVSFAWAGFGATFGPIMIFSLFWKRTTRAGAIAGMVSGAGMVFLWKLVISELGGVFAIYELLPAFIFSSICIVVVSLLTKAPSKEIVDEFEKVAAMKD